MDACRHDIDETGCQRAACRQRQLMADSAPSTRQLSTRFWTILKGFTRLMD